MSEREKQNRFLRELIDSENSTQIRELRTRITKAERDERCVRSAVFLVAVFALLSAAGLGYSAVLVPEFFQSSTPLIVKAFTVLMLTCVICLLGFLGFWWWYRGICNRLYTECRNWLMALRKPRQAPDDVQNQGVSLYPLMTSHPDEDQIVNFPRTSA